MRRIFSRRHRNSDSGPSRPSQSSTSGLGNNRRSLDHFRHDRSPARSFIGDETYHLSDSLLDNPNSELNLDNADDGYNDATSVESAPLSESDTLFLTNQERLSLQPTFQENFSLYLPFLIRRLRYERMYEHSDLASSQETVASVAEKYSVLDQPTHNYNEKRRMILVHEFMKNSNLVFISMESFTLYRELRSLKKEKQAEMATKYQSKGLALPLFKIESHSYLRLDDGADVIFHKYLELPSTQMNSNSGSANPVASPTYKFCTVHIKTYTNLKRFTFTFNPQDGRTSPFKVILFQHNFKPIADFNYKNTRFRIFGNSLINFGLAPNLKLLIIDKDKPSLCDKVFDKPQFKLSSIVRRRRSSAVDPSAPNSRRGSSVGRRRSSAVSINSNCIGEEECIAPDENFNSVGEAEDEEGVETDPLKMANPYPDKSNPLLKYDQNQYLLLNKTFVSNEVPPFGSFQDVVCYAKDFSLLPKKFKEQGRFEIYQDSSRFVPGVNMDANNSLDMDTLVLCCINLAIRDMVVKRNSKISSNMEAINRYNYMGASIYASPGPGLLGGL
ncbi:hypothetical protein CLIB1423_11S03202 [[Candida] railenensis]|uniref:Uncharacterized protein n=1 Tax=[Candida] railenensis TaxID=45579 RepID=A0A9P0VYC9_9ASCO|nr:hypothetical protein CLIB1423_11S03202 [[Candida] railenensis]